MQGLSHFLLQVLCSNTGTIRGVLVLGQSEKAPFSKNSAQWSRLHEVLAFALYDAILASSLVRFTTFAELFQLVPAEAEAVLFMDRWLPAILVGVPPLLSPQLLSLFRSFCWVLTAWTDLSMSLML
jgi:hypothetical protein